MRSLPIVVTGVEKRDVSIHTNTDNIIYALRRKFGFIPEDSCYTLVEYKGDLCWESNGATHGSYKAEYTLMSNDKKLLAMFNAINSLEKAVHDYEEAG